MKKKHTNPLVMSPMGVVKSPSIGESKPTNTSILLESSTRSKDCTSVESDERALEPIYIDCSSYEHGGSDYLPGIRDAITPSPSVEMAWMSASLSKNNTHIRAPWGEYGILKSWGIDRKWRTAWSIYAAGYEWSCVFIPQGVEWEYELIEQEINNCAPYLVPDPESPFSFLRKYDAAEEAKRVAKDTENHRLIVVTHHHKKEIQTQSDLSEWMRFAPHVCFEIATFMAQAAR